MMDVSVIKLVVVALFTICLLCISGEVLLQVTGNAASPILGVTLTVCVGAIVGILATQRQDQR